MDEHDGRILERSPCFAGTKSVILKLKECVGFVFLARSITPDACLMTRKTNLNFQCTGYLTVTQLMFEKQFKYNERHNGSDKKKETRIQR